MILIKNVQVFAPKALGKKDVLLAYDKILEIADCIEPWRDDLTVIDAAGKMLVSSTSTFTSSAAAARAASKPGRRNSSFPRPLPPA